MTEQRELTPEEKAIIFEVRELEKIRDRQRVEVDEALDAMTRAETTYNHRLKAQSAIEAQLKAVRGRMNRFDVHVAVSGPEQL